MSEGLSIPTALADLDRLLADEADPTDWASATNRSSLRSLQRLYTEAALNNGRRARLRFARGDVVGSAGPAHLLLKFVSEINEAVVAAANSRLPRPHRTIDDRVRDQLGLWLFAPQPGSVVFEVVVPPPSTPPNAVVPDAEAVAIPGTSDVESLSESALERVLAALQLTTETAADSDALAQSLSQLGTSAIRHLNRVAARTEVGFFSVDIQASGGTAPDRSFAFQPRDAAALRSVIRNRALDRVTLPFVGVISTASRRRSIFDLETDDGQVVTGAVPAELRSAVADLFDRRVRIEVEEQVDPNDAEGVRVRRKLVSVEPAPI